jgi:hypothetical protein
MQAQCEAQQRPLQTLVLNADRRPLSTWPLSVVPAPRSKGGQTEWTNILATC